MFSPLLMHHLSESVTIGYVWQILITCFPLKHPFHSSFLGKKKNHDMMMMIIICFWVRWVFVIGRIEAVSHLCTRRLAHSDASEMMQRFQRWHPSLHACSDVLHGDAAAIFFDSDLVRGHLSPEAWAGLLHFQQVDTWHTIIEHLTVHILNTESQGQSLPCHCKLIQPLLHSHLNCRH